MIRGASRYVTSKFTQEDDNRLKKLVSKYGTDSWREVSKYFPYRNERQCRDRWEKFLCPSLNKGPFTEEEDMTIMRLHAELGPKWMTISRLMNNRSDVSIKSRYNSLMKRINTQKNSSFAQKSENISPKIATEACIPEVSNEISDPILNFDEKSRQLFDTEDFFNDFIIF
ncbi:Myb-like DNA-binding domain containing protein [Trichomonas vaginalis G3]|uniref:Myb-like DNA-binding domain containing protein n=1 Tax=Trichomonas vaginalis (strain ATCC PRA-98 / G3) TaxID=412133 RepID=A2DXR8_TRIV3|nr:RNA polymerase II transcription regulator recruiting protein [Trichomonas vaginalis G3]EAY14778.1 Myb-like DNA-binding domain containing protein [Trichomonas vaginalis G3]KAI5508052.1 RNA polymerase II transcription regulator recruiting protein [Trichomonas vaginalis G3]|eukprot:XP_001327001.1 Myb-like DNA-binding domain containing protein [Trichomonas vaginalis G3]